MYESEIYNLFLNNIMRNYNIDSEDKAFKYFKLRFLIFETEKEATKNNLCKFLISELNMDNSKGLVYKGVKIDSICNIMYNWEFRASLYDESDIWASSVEDKKLTMNDFIEKAYLNIKKDVSNKLKKISSNDPMIAKYIGIKCLNKLFNTRAIPPKKIKGFYYGSSHNPYERTIEEKLDALIKVNNLKLIKEKDVEAYLIGNLDLIEKGLKYVDNQVFVRGGRIDVLAKDRRGNYVIIELKVEEDKEIIWQALYYPEAIKEKYKTDKVRFLTLCPGYKPHLLTALKKTNAEIYSYDINSNFDKIKNLKIRRNYEK